MAGFKTHITVSSIAGVGYGAAGALWFHQTTGEVPVSSCLLATGLCGISGMLPDLDSDSGIPLRETVAFGAAVVPMMMMDRFTHLGMSHESMVLAGGLMYLAVRFGFANLLKKFTVHRGMFHSVPALLIAGLLAFLVCACDDLTVRYYRAGAVVLGFGSHLLLDELYSVEWYRGRFRLKKSFGTAVKFWGQSRLANLGTYLQLGILGLIAFGDPIWMEDFNFHQHRSAPMHVERSAEDDHHGTDEKGDHAGEADKNWHRTALEAIKNLWR